MIARLQSKLANYWFEPIPAERLAILRFATGSFALWYLLSRFDMLQRMSRSGVSNFEPIGLLFWMSEPLPPMFFDTILLLLIGLNIAYILGWKFRYTGPSFALLLLLFLTYRNSWSMIYHNRNALVLQVFIIGWVGSADVLSWDSWKKRAKAVSHWRYGWPIKLICAVTLATYFVSGVAKLLGEMAWDWANGSALRSQVAVDAIRKELLGASASPIFEWLYPYTWVFLVMGVMTLVLELGAPLMLWRKRWRLIWVLLILSMHWGIFFIMGIRFRFQMTGIAFLAFFDLEQLWFGIKKRLPFLPTTDIRPNPV